jgi:initiation factor 1A
MVRNTTGGSKTKCQARKGFTASRQNTALRVSQDENELYAQVLAPLGNGMCHVVCIEDGVTRLCHIRGKFRGHSKRDNIIKRGTWVMVGRREWEKETTGKKLQNCDLLEVYSDFERDRLKTTVKQDWSLFVSNDNANANLEETSMPDSFVFSDDKMDEYRDLLEKDILASKDNDAVQNVIVEDDDVIDVDDI